MKQLRVLLLPPGWDASPSQGYLPAVILPPVSILYTWAERDNVGLSFLSKETTRWQGLGLKPSNFRPEVQHANHYTTAPPCAALYPVKVPYCRMFFKHRKNWMLQNETATCYWEEKMSKFSKLVQNLHKKLLLQKLAVKGYCLTSG